MDIGRRFGANLNQARRASGLSQERLAGVAGMHRTEIGLLERGRRVPRIDTVAKLARALQIGPGSFWSESPQITSPRVTSAIGKAPIKELTAKTKGKRGRSNEGGPGCPKRTAGLPQASARKHQPRPPTHYEPSGFVPEPPVFDRAAKVQRSWTQPPLRATDFGTASPCGGRL